MPDAVLIHRPADFAVLACRVLAPERGRTNMGEGASGGDVALCNSSIVHIIAVSALTTTLSLTANWHTSQARCLSARRALSPVLQHPARPAAAAGCGL